MSKPLLSAPINGYFIKVIAVFKSLGESATFLKHIKEVFFANIHIFNVINKLCFRLHHNFVLVSECVDENNVGIRELFNKLCNGFVVIIGLNDGMLVRLSFFTLWMVLNKFEVVIHCDALIQ
jgi:hypothetical protein